MDEAPKSYSRYFKFFILFSSLVLMGWVGLFAVVALIDSLIEDVELYERFDLELYSTVSAMALLSVISAIASIGYIAVSRSIQQHRWVWSFVILVSVFFNFTGFVLLIFFFVCLGGFRQEPGPVPNEP